ncbi:MAG: PAS domain-containing protein [Desulfobacterales bacterium]|nr:PAS domain-containing protein [Desulfobacterales bacterium]
MTISDINLDKWIKEEMFDAVPIATGIIDRSFNIVHANKAFENIFGPWKDKKCYSVYKKRDSACPPCKWPGSHKGGASQVHREMGFDKTGRLTTYISHTFPIVDEKGNIPFLVVMTTDTTETEKMQREHKLLFDQVPCSILIIDKDFRIVRTNQRIRDEFGDIEGKHCYNVLKGLDHKCLKCTARQTFSDGKMHSDVHTWKYGKGEKHQLVTTVPLREADGSFDVVMEMTVDITQKIQLQDELKIAHAFMETMIATSIDGIFAIDSSGDVTIFNAATRKIFKVDENYKVSKEELVSMLPEGFLPQVRKTDKPVYFPEAEVKDINGETIPVRLVGVNLIVGDRSMGRAFSIQDLRDIKKLETEKMEAERLAVVGQTVAGLAHGVKNLITALEGGMYMLNTGLQKGQIDRIQKGMEMLIRNIDRISMFVKAFLSYSKGRVIHVKPSNPGEIAREVVELYSTKAEDMGVKLTIDQPLDIAPALIDYESMHECLTNLIGNAIDACQISDDGGGCKVVVRIFEKDGVITYEVFDNGCGMDYEVKQKVFTTFFTTKGLGGSGIGLLMAKKIVQEHGGKIDLESEHGYGTTFRIRLPRNRLPKQISDEEDSEE